MVAEVKQNRFFANSAWIQNWLNRLGPVLGLLLVIAVIVMVINLVSGRRAV